MLIRWLVFAGAGGIRRVLCVLPVPLRAARADTTPQVIGITRWPRSFNAALKNGAVYRPYPTRRHAVNDVTCHIEHRYNTRRIHQDSDIGHLKSPRRVRGTALAASNPLPSCPELRGTSAVPDEHPVKRQPNLRISDRRRAATRPICSCPGPTNQKPSPPEGPISPPLDKTHAISVL